YTERRAAHTELEVNKMMAPRIYHLLVLLALAAAAPFAWSADEAVPKKGEYYEALKEPREKPPAGLEIYGPFADRCLDFEAAGLRVSLPAGYLGQRPGTGLVTDFGLKGDFEITLGFEILGEP